MEVLQRIKRLVVRGRYRFTYKAVRELHLDGLEPEDALESILNAQAVRKTVRSHGGRTGRREKLYVIESFSYQGTLIYTKGRFAREDGEEVYYLLISSKRSTIAD